MKRSHPEEAAKNFVISHPQKLKTCIGFLLNGHLFKAIVSNENILRDNNEKGQLPIGQVVGINISSCLSAFN